MREPGAGGPWRAKRTNVIDPADRFKHGPTETGH